ncbi:O-fucosyltransferase 30-like protein [Drosera capensis]
MSRNNSVFHKLSHTLQTRTARNFSIGTRPVGARSDGEIRHHANPKIAAASISPPPSPPPRTLPHHPHLPISLSPQPLAIPIPAMRRRRNPRAEQAVPDVRSAQRVQQSGFRIQERDPGGRDPESDADRAAGVRSRRGGARYISLTNILDISSFSSEIQTIDFRDFVSLWCGVDLSHVCSTDSITKSSALDILLQCGSQLSGLNGTVNDCLYTVDEDCRSTVWTYDHKSEEDGSLDSFQPDDQLREKKKISFIRRRLNVYKRLGPGSKAHSATLVAFGSLFTAKYKGSELLIDIHESRVDHRIQLLIEKIGFIPFSPVITEAGKKYSSKIMSPFLCAQLRLLDGQFKNHWKTTFSALREKVESLKEVVRTRPIHIFIMTDLPPSNWSGTYLWDLARDVNSFKLHLMSEDVNFVMTTAKKVASFGFDMRPKTAAGDHNYYCSNGQLPDILLYLEETVCACSSLGFVGTVGSTIAESIELMRRNAICAR